MALHLAFDRSSRSYDADGRLRVQISNISKACVNEYMGAEIPNYSDLGLDPNKVYKIYRPADELEKAAPTFNNLPLLTKHVPVSAADPRKELVVGATGTDAVFNAPYLQNSLIIWDQAAIDGIESRAQTELSCAYRYELVLDPGAYNGETFDGYMTNIIGNHVALVEVGRAGPDVVVGDSSNPEIKTGKTAMSKKLAEFAAKLKPFLAQDADLSPEELAMIIQAAGQAEMQEHVDDPEGEAAEGQAYDADDVIAKIMEYLDGKLSEEDMEAINKIVGGGAEATAEDMPEAGKPPLKEGMKGAMDSAAVSRMVKDAEKRVASQFAALRKAEKDVAPLVGDVAAMDSADAVYKFALEQAGVSTKGVHPSAFPAMVAMVKSQREAAPVVSMAADSATHSDFKKMFGDIKLPKMGV